MDKRKCDCGAESYYDEPIAQGNMLCESCYVGELEAIAGTQEFYHKRVKELEAVVEKARKFAKKYPNVIPTGLMDILGVEWRTDEEKDEHQKILRDFACALTGEEE